MLLAMNTLYLTGTEQAIFDVLPKILTEGWKTERELLTYEDSPERRQLRLALLRLHDPALIALREKTQQSHSVKEVAEMIAEMDMRKVDEDDLASLFFALGPNDLSLLIKHLLRAAESDKDVEGVTALTVVRHAVLQAFHSVARH